MRDLSSCRCDCENYHLPGCDTVHNGRHVMFQKSLLVLSKGYINYHHDGGKKFI